ncbi:hypothetical protein P154DRAFT_534509 [Amniculicola lignicola CBS 123094]|uniref:Uncharacterized protein n=1 Tax=Amniculicola lignicola CBS 123094 TaxID=1392246 RepID=A0A6A5WFR0_9PLEO|nr:hypothetical protein P154DRAFT_534509 [Amniculicola lignicola CBS 123094]
MLPFVDHYLRFLLTLSSVLAHSSSDITTYQLLAETSYAYIRDAWAQLVASIMESLGHPIMGGIGIETNKIAVPTLKGCKKLRCLTAPLSALVDQDEFFIWSDESACADLVQCLPSSLEFLGIVGDSFLHAEALLDTLRDSTTYHTVQPSVGLKPTVNTRFGGWPASARTPLTPASTLPA